MLLNFVFDYQVCADFIYVSFQFIEEAERSLHDAIMIVRRAVKNSTVVPGGGAIDVCGIISVAFVVVMCRFPC